jgi:hypothetical protein
MIATALGRRSSAAARALLVCSLVASTAQAQPDAVPKPGETGTSSSPPKEAVAAPDTTATPSPAAMAAAPPPAPTTDASPFTGALFGFIEERFNATSAEPNGDRNPDGTPSRSRAVADLQVPGFHVMAQGSLYSRYRYYFNLAAFDADAPTRDEPLSVRNAWLETSILGDYLNLRVGKIYRRFGLYNEILDTIPSFIGIEPPVSLVGSRPMLTRTTNAMLHGRASHGDITLSYAATVGKDENSANDAVWSPGFDLNIDWNSTILLGTSYYNTAGRVVPDVELGQGSPAGGVAPWMAQDRYSVYGGYARLTIGSFLLQGEGWISPHNAVRDPERVLLLAQNAEHFSAVNRARMGIVGNMPTADQVITAADYTYRTFEVRAAYSFEVGAGADPIEITPYANFDYIKNLESISDAAYGGDGQPGESPHGLLMHARVGAVVKPVPVVAFKLELTHAMSDYGDQFAQDEEVWMSLTYQWELVRK